MPGKSRIIWSIKELVIALRQRQLNKFDVNIAISGKRGDGKSTFANKLLLRFDNFKQWKQQVYTQQDVISLLRDQKFAYCWDDEAINSGYKRDFQKSGQKELIKIVSAYRSNYNIYISAIPFFYSLDKDLRDLIQIHIHILERGLAVALKQLDDQIHSQDPWDTKNNARLEEKWLRLKQKNPNFKLPYHKLSTFMGYITFGDLTPKQRKKYEEIREIKRQKAFAATQETEEQKEQALIDTIYKLLLERKLTKSGLMQVCLTNNKKYSNVCAQLNYRLKNDGVGQTLSHYLVDDTADSIHIKSRGAINKLVPSF